MNRILVNRAALAAIFIALAASLYTLPFADWITAIVEWSKLHPVAGPIAYVVIVVVATVLFVPGSVSMMVGGFLFGLLPGFLFAAIAIAGGAQCGFLAGRIAARHWVEKKVAANPRMQAIEKGLSEEAFLIVLLTRLSLVIPFNVLNYAYGVTSVTARTHLVATTLGMLPAAGLYVLPGHAGPRSRRDTCRRGDAIGPRVLGRGRRDYDDRRADLGYPSNRQPGSRPAPADTGGRRCEMTRRRRAGSEQGTCCMA